MNHNGLIDPKSILADREPTPARNGDHRHAVHDVPPSKYPIVGDSAALRQCLDLANKAAKSKTTVLLLGESGTGKEIFAKTIHDLSDRTDKPFVAINCVGLSRELLESELFGHEKGAFTGAHELKRGKIELANRGTVFLDEIGDMNPELQTKLLRFIQERQFERVGATQMISVDIRIVAATNRDLESAVQEGRFRSDLYYRLNVLPITLPPLRERKEDIAHLTRFFLRRLSLDTRKNFTGLTQDAEERLLAYDWPGNVRELANVIERAVVLGQEPLITGHDLPACIAAPDRRRASTIVSYREAVENCKRDLIQRILARTNGNRAAAARTLGLRRTYLLKLMKSLAIE